MSFIDEIRSDRAGWLARARAAGDDPLPDMRDRSMYVPEGLGPDRFDESSLRDRPDFAAGSASLGRMEPVGERTAGQGADRVVGGRTGDRSPNLDGHVRRSGRVGR